MADELPPILSLHEVGPGQYALRLYDVKRQSLASGVAKLFPEIQSLLLILPNEMRQFHMGNPAPAEPEGDFLPPSEEPPIKTVRRIRSETKKSAAESERSCGRCSGTGQIAMLMEGGEATQTTCPVCKGDGQIKSFGIRK